MMKLFDAHCHLQDTRIISKAPQLIKAAQDTGVVGFAVNGVCEQDWHLVKHLAHTYPSLLPSFGLHPWSLTPLSFPSHFSVSLFFFFVSGVVCFNWASIESFWALLLLLLSHANLQVCC